MNFPFLLYFSFIFFPTLFPLLFVTVEPKRKERKLAPSVVCTIYRSQMDLGLRHRYLVDLFMYLQALQAIRKIIHI